MISFKDNSIKNSFREKALHLNKCIELTLNYLS